MNDPTSLNLDYADPLPPADLADRARRQGSRARRLRRGAVTLGLTGTLCAGVALAGSFAFGAPDDGSLSVQPAGESSQPGAAVARTDNLPTSVGTGPSAQRFAAPGFVAGEYVPNDRRVGHEPGAERLLTASTNGEKSVLLTTKNAELCIGSIDKGATVAQPSVCQPLFGLPAEGFWGGGFYAPTPQRGAADTSAIAFGLVRGKVSRVVVSTPRGEVEALLAPTLDPALGTLYWAKTTVPMEANSEVAKITVVAYRGERAVFMCDESPCSAKHVEIPTAP
jgi:hypothetical protein